MSLQGIKQHNPATYVLNKIPPKHQQNAAAGPTNPPKTDMLTPTSDTTAAVCFWFILAYKHSTVRMPFFVVKLVLELLVVSVIYILHLLFMTHRWRLFTQTPRRGPTHPRVWSRPRRALGKQEKLWKHKKLSRRSRYVYRLTFVFCLLRKKILKFLTVFLF